MIADEIVREAEKWLEVPWKHQGRTQRGLDCAGLIIRIGNDLQLIQYDVKSYPRHTHRDAFILHFKNVLVEKPVPQRQKGDILLLRDGIYACHCGIVDLAIDGEYLIHAYEPRKKVVKEYLTKELLNKVTHCFSYPLKKVNNG